MTAFPHALALAALLPICAAAKDAAWTWNASPIQSVGFDLEAAQVLRVTTLAANGKGSLAEALRTPGPRIIVFDVGGVIDLGRKSLELREPQVFIAGQTAPSPGITLIRGGLNISASQSVVQHLSVRPGDAGQPKRSGWSPDGITTTGGPVDVRIDHCSVTWSCDEGISAATYRSPTGEPARRITISNCIIAEGLSNATHEKGEHSKGTLVFDGTQEVAIVGNLYAANTERNPVFKLNTSGVVVNNVVAGCGQRAIHATVPDAGQPAQAKARIAVVANVVLFGEKTKKSSAIFEGIADGFFKDNEGFDWGGNPLPLLRSPFPTLEQPPVWPEGLQARTPSAALWQVARFAGARPAERSPIDERIVQQALTGRGRIIDSQDEVGGYPNLQQTTHRLEVPDRNRAEWLERLARVVTIGSSEK